ncbi:MAG: DUF4405 domain-containing protein [Polyangia bacterium]
MSSDDGRRKRKFKTRSVISLLTALAFAISGLTGLVLFVEPYGRVAYWSGWTFLGLGKDEWDGIHVISSWLFIVVGIWHLVLNWHAFVGHLRRRVHNAVHLRAELAVALAVALLVIASGIWSLPPLSWILDLNEEAKNAWTENFDQQPPYGHAELSTLSTLCGRLGVDPEEARRRLEEEGIEVVGEDPTIEEIARENGLRPSQVFEAMGGSLGGFGRGAGRGLGGGRGLGREQGLVPELNFGGAFDTDPSGGLHGDEWLDHHHRSGRGRGLGRGLGDGRGLGRGLGDGRSLGRGLGDGRDLGRRRYRDMDAGVERDRDTDHLLDRDAGPGAGRLRHYDRRYRDRYPGFGRGQSGMGRGQGPGSGLGRGRGGGGRGLGPGGGRGGGRGWW